MPLSAPERILRIIQKAIGLMLLSTPEFIPEIAHATQEMECRRHGTFPVEEKFKQTLRKKGKILLYVIMYVHLLEYAI